MARFYARRTSFVFWVCARLAELAEAQICYLPGTTASQDIAREQYPCDPYAYTTLCCPLGWTCFSNNLCVVTDVIAAGGGYSAGTSIRGTCTNPSWNDTACGDFCLDDLDNGFLQDCGGGNWCCQSAVTAGTCSCESGTGTFSIPDGEAETIIGVTGGSTSTSAGSPSGKSSSATQTTSSAVSSTRSGTSASKTSSSSTSASASKSSTFLTSATSSSHTSPSSTSQLSSSTSSAAAAVAATTHSLTTGQKAGISVSVILGVTALVVGAFCLWAFWWRHRERRDPVPATSDADSDIYIPEPNSAVPGPILRPNSDMFEYRGSDGLRLSPVSDMGSSGRGYRENDLNSGWSGGYSGGFAGTVTSTVSAEGTRQGVNPYQRPYEGT